MAYGVPLGFVLTLVWLGFSGLLDPLILGLGAASPVLVVWLCRRMGVVDGEGVPLGLRYARLAAYVRWLAWEIVNAIVDGVAGRVLGKVERLHRYHGPQGVLART